MSVAGLSKTVRNKILNNINIYENTARNNLNRGIKVMDISPQILDNNFNNIDSNRVYKLLKSTLLSKKIKQYTTENKLSSQVQYISNGNGITLVAKDFNAISSFLNSSVDSKTLLNTDSKINPLSYAGITQLSTIQKNYDDIYKDLNIRYNAEFVKSVNLSVNSVKGIFNFTYFIPEEYSKASNLNKLEEKVINNLKNDLVYQIGSKSIFMSLLDQITKLFHGKKSGKDTSTTTVSGKTKPKKGKIKATTKRGVKAPPLQDASGRFTSTIKILELLKPLVEQNVRTNMDSAAYFKTDTDNFTKTVDVVNVTRLQNNLLIKYEWQSERYGSFLPGGKHHRFGREPNEIIRSSIRAAAIKVVGTKFKVFPVGGL